MVRPCSFAKLGCTEPALPDDTRCETHRMIARAIALRALIFRERTAPSTPTEDDQ